MNCRRLIFLLLLFAVSGLNTGYAQDKTRLRKAMAALKNAPDDTNKVLNLDYVAWDTSYDNLSVALKYGEECLRLAEKLHFNNGIMYSCNTLGTIYSDMGDLNNALKYHLRGLSIAEQIRRPSSMGTAELNISIVYSQMKENGKALEYLKRSEKHFKEAGNQKSLAVVYNGLGDTYLLFPDSIDRALWSYNQAYDIAIRLDKVITTAISLNGIAKCYHAKGDSVHSDLSIKRALFLLDSGKNDYDYSLVLLDYARILKDRGHYAKAESSLTDALKIFRTIGMREKELEYWHLLADISEKSGKMQQSVDAWEHYSMLKDSVLNENVFSKQRELEAYYQNEKQESEIKSLRQEKQITQLDLAKRTAEKERLTVFVTLSIIAFLLVIGFAAYIYLSLQQKKKASSLIEEKNREITDSINYSRRIQTAILPDEKQIANLLGEHFILYKPKDIVSGDFYFIEEVRTNEGEKLITVAAADCTGHGVPGAFMSIFGYTYLKQSLTEKHVNSPGDALDFLNTKLDDLFHRNASETAIRDGMDIAFCVINRAKNTCWFSGANNPAWLLRDGEIREIAADKQPVGYHERSQPFTNKTIDVLPGDVLYLFTDGFADQFGGPQGKKFKYRQLKELLISCGKLPMAGQKKELESAFNNWKGNLEQVDDVLVIGIRI